ncbi:MAG TPA: ABC transporter permease [candidate division Zixibacteria bacterium]|nr:ABC transporter permease [candidate division Zixibacteria bacterium]
MRRLPLREPAAIAFETMRTHKLRSFLMLLGVILAVSTLILVVALINGTNIYIADRVANMGNGVFLIMRFGIINNDADYVRAVHRNRPITWDDFVALRDGLKLPKNVGVETRSVEKVKYGGESAEDVSLRGVTANIGEMDTEEVARGRYISDNDNEHRTFVAMIGDDIVKKLFPNVDPIGKVISVKGYDFEVVGVAKPIGSVMGQPQDNFVYIPVQAWFKLNGSHPDGMAINIQARAPEMLEQTKEEARTMMRARRHVPFNEEDNFGVVGADNLMDLWQSLTGTLAGAMVAFVSIFLVIGGIVIMNVMLASVTERTREIGIRKSLGARTSDIMSQFLVESAVMSAVGGALGIALAWLAAIVLDKFTPLPMSVPLTAVITSLVVSASVGLFFGVYPARKAARLDPIEALRADS